MTCSACYRVTGHTHKPIHALATWVAPRSLPSSAASMSRLCCSDPELFARYSQAKLQTDLCLKSDTASRNSAGFPVSLQVVQIYSDQLADLVQVALERDESELVVIGAPSKALDLFVQAMYGHSLKETLCPFVDDVHHITRDLKDILWFGHKYNITQMESAVCEVITSDLCGLTDAGTEAVIDFYNNVPLECSTAQDAIFQIMLACEDAFDFEIMQSVAAIAPRHVNKMLKRDSRRPASMLVTLQLFVEKQEKTEFPWNFEVIVPTPSDLESLNFKHKDIDEWREFATELEPGIFKSNIDHWIQNMLILLNKQLREERNAYRQHIQAQYPNKRIRFEAGQLSFQ